MLDKNCKKYEAKINKRIEKNKSLSEPDSYKKIWLNELEKLEKVVEEGNKTNWKFNDEINLVF
jgi:hypothetical protein